MIFVSSACLRRNRIKDSVAELAEHGFRNIELSGGTQFYDGYLQDLHELKAKHDLTYLLHNYFPPPPNDFVLNLASDSESIVRQTRKHLEAAVKLAIELETDKFGFHAGYFFDPDAKQLGSRITKAELFSPDLAIARFSDRFTALQEMAGPLDLYLENNVLSASNYASFDGQIPFMLVDQASHAELSARVDYKLLLDVGHLKVSCQTLGLDFEAELVSLFSESDYLHLSDNDGLHDQNGALKADSEMVELLRELDFGSKTITLEVYGRPQQIEESHEILSKLLHGGMGSHNPPRRTKVA